MFCLGKSWVWYCRYPNFQKYICIGSLALLLSLAVIFSVPSSAIAQSAEPSIDQSVDDAVEDIYSDSRYQSEPPFDVKAEKVEKKVPEKKEEASSEPLPDLSALEFLAKIIFYGLLAVGLFLLIKLAYQQYKDFKRRPQNKITVNEKTESFARVSSISEELSKETLEHADQLAEQGHFEAAIRAILLCCLKHVKESYHATLPDALTNREILQADWLPSDIQTKMSIIVNAEELTEFGGRSAGIEEFTACRDAFQVFMTPANTTQPSRAHRKTESDRHASSQHGGVK